MTDALIHGIRQGKNYLRVPATAVYALPALSLSSPPWGAVETYEHRGV
jgi:hypothetical protein